MNQMISYPLLCTRGAVIFPLQDMTIEVGRNVSIDAVNYAINHNINIVLVSQTDLTVDSPTLDDVYKVGTVCRIKNSRVRDDHLRVIFTGIRRCLIHTAFLKDGVNHVEVELLEDEVQDEQEIQSLTKRAIKEFNAIAAKYSRAGFSVSTLISFDARTASSLADTFAQIYVQGSKEKQQFLEELSVKKRLEMMLETIYHEQQMDIIEKELNEKVKEQIEDGQKDYYLREKLKAIKDELGDNKNYGDIDDLKEKLENNPYPEAIKKKAREEFGHYEMLPPSSGESGVIRSYLEWLLDVPWYQKSEDNNDLALAQQILDEDHYGLTKVKERILEYLAVKQMTNSLKSPIICLVGPPGVGKTSLAKSVARALDRKFIKISLGGVKDEAEIRGHRRTYLGSMPGRIIQGMKRAGTLNPVFLIDEIDKMSSDYKGDPSSAMLEVLDPEQNNQFSDHYLEEPYDLSDVLFIATANYAENIPAALYDRLEIINLSSYTEVEKLHIAKDHLIPKQMNTNGLKSGQMVLDDDRILYLIRHYTREAGVRQLERQIGALCRKTVLEILKDKKKSVRITKALIQKWLGHEIFDFGTKEKKDQIGVVTGLAYTSFGGDILPVEVNYFEGKGKLIVTGQLGDVMVESTKIALDYIKANARKYKIDIKFFDEHDIHLHVPEGAVPKDGPSAGVTITTALLSAITLTPVHANLAMTGEVTLRGNVLPIGGLKEKSLAAHRSGITRIIIPKGNVKDLDDIPEEVKEKITFVPVERVDQVIKEALVNA
ncbi:MAG: endopeptidase La [Erysipelotrichaceae bacterium]|nr:endopeptidase La [Erysipelotrichaceae bacterium]